MDSRAFASAFYKRDGQIESVLIEEISKELYISKYRGYLFCPNEKCNARLKVVYRKNGEVSMFQSIRIKEHIRDCPYCIEYVKYDSDAKVRKKFSTGHIREALRRQMLKLGGKHTFTQKINATPQTGKIKGSHDEPPIYYYNCENVNEKLIGRAICVGGVIHSVVVNDEDDPQKIHAYINYQMPDSRRISVRINNNRYIKDNNTGDIVNQIRQSKENATKDNQPTCLCFGWIKKSAKGIDVVPPDITAIGIVYSAVAR